MIIFTTEKNYAYDIFVNTINSHGAYLKIDAYFEKLFFGGGLFQNRGLFENAQPNIKVKVGYPLSYIS